MTFERAALILAGVLFAGPGALFLLAPGFAGPVVALEPRAPLGLADLRAVFGGLELGLAAYLLGSAFAAARERRRAALVLAAFAYSGLVAARVLSLALDGSPGALGFALLGPEVIALALVVATLARADA